MDKYSKSKMQNTDIFNCMVSKYIVLHRQKITHTSLGKLYGSFSILDEHSEEFYKAYTESFNAGENLYLTEKHRHVCPVLVDLDFRFDGDDLSRRHTINDINEIIQLYADLLIEHFEITTQFEAYVMEKSKPSLTDKGVVKDGIHIMFPTIVSKPSVQYVIRTKMLKKMKDVIGRLNCTNPISDVINEAVIERNNWLMYGSKKTPEGEAYKVTTRYVIENKVAKLVPLDPNAQYITMFSIRNKYDETIINMDVLEEIRAYEAVIEITKKNEYVRPTNLSNQYVEVKDIATIRKELQDLIFASRTGTHHDIGQVVYRMFHHNYVCTCIKSNTWYEFHDHRWHKKDGVHTLRLKLSTDVSLEYMAAARDWTQRAIDERSEGQQQFFLENAKKMAEIGLKLKNKGFKNTIMSECKEVFYDAKFKKELDNNLNLVCFNNGVYNIDIGELRQGRPEDKISFCNDVDYLGFIN